MEIVEQKETQIQITNIQQNADNKKAEENNGNQQNQDQQQKNGQEEQPQAQEKTFIKPYPIAEQKLQVKILDLIHQAFSLQQVKKGVNESLKNLSKGTAEIVILAADCDPLEILMSLPSQCEEKNVPYCFINSQAALGRACGIKRPVVAATITYNEGSQLNSQILEMKDSIEQLFI